jgi:hypothetical protein
MHARRSTLADPSQHEAIPLSAQEGSLAPKETAYRGNTHSETCSLQLLAPREVGHVPDVEPLRNFVAG